MTTPASGDQHVLVHGDYRAEIASVGASLRVLTFRGRDLVVPFAADQVRPAFRGATLAPWPNRIVDGRYEFAGALHQAALTEPGRGHALHGLCGWAQWDAVTATSSSVTLATTIQPQEGYPWRVRVETDYVLGSDGLTQRVRATNLSAAPAPFGTGPHPYLVAPGRLDDWIMHVPAGQVLAVTEDRLSPAELSAVTTDAARFDFRQPRPIGAVEIDHAFTDLDRDGAGMTAVQVVDAAGVGAAITWDARCPWVQIHTADLPGGRTEGGHRIGLAAEPMTCAPDAFNDEQYPFDTGLVVIGPSASHEASWRISAVS